MADTSAFYSSSTRQTGLYNYSTQLKTEQQGSKGLQAVMQSDLKTLFGHSVKLTDSLMPIYSLTVLDQQLMGKLKSTAGERSIKGDYSGYEFQNAEIKDLVKILSGYHNKRPVIDATGIGFPIDLRLEASMTNLESVQKALRANRLELIEGKKLMQVLVISGR